MSRGKFIVLEGGEGSGKTSCLEYLKEALRDRNVFFTREPGGTVVAERIRNFIFSQYPEEAMEAETELLLFCAARIQHIKKFILPMLESGAHIICDRFDLSTYAYQIIARGRNDLKESFAVLDAFARGGVIKDRKWVNVLDPDFYILLDVSPAVGLARRGAHQEEVNRFDEEKFDFHQRVADGLRRAVCGKRYAAVVDANASQDEVRRNVLAHIKNVLGMKA